jgi:hypothetical protein
LTKTPQPPFGAGQWKSEDTAIFVPELGWYGGFRPDLANFIVDIVNKSVESKE